MIERFKKRVEKKINDNFLKHATMTQKKALNQLEEYCRVNNMHLINSTFIKGAYALVIHDAPGEWVQGVANMPCRRLSGYLTPKELLLWLDGYHAGLQANKNK